MPVISGDLKLPPRGIAAAAYAKNVPPAHFLYAAASEMTLLMTDGVTISPEIEPYPSCKPLVGKGQRPFPTVRGTRHPGRKAGCRELPYERGNDYTSREPMAMHMPLLRSKSMMSLPEMSMWTLEPMVNRVEPKTTPVSRKSSMRTLMVDSIPVGMAP